MPGGVCADHCREMAKPKESNSGPAPDPSVELQKAHDDIAALRREVELLNRERDMQYDSQEKRVAAVRLIANMENRALYDECETLIGQSKERRQLDQLLQIPFGQLSHVPCNPVIGTFIDELTKTSTSNDDGKRRTLLQNEVVECLRRARHNRCVRISCWLSGCRLCCE